MPSSEDFQMNVKGLDSLAAKLDAFPFELSRTVLRSALAAAGRVYVPILKAHAPVGKDPDHAGTLRDAIKMKITLGRNLDENRVVVGPAYSRKNLPVSKRTGKVVTSRSPGVYSRFVSLGTSKQAPNPWMQAAASAANQTATEALFAKLKEGIKQVAETLARRK